MQIIEQSAAKADYSLARDIAFVLDEIDAAERASQPLLINMRVLLGGWVQRAITLENEKRHTASYQAMLQRFVPVDTVQLLIFGYFALGMIMGAAFYHAFRGA